MARALQLAQRGCFTTHPNPRVGCVIVDKGQVVGEGFHERAGAAHAEAAALHAAAERARGATVYVTLEPCSHHGRTPPCADALIAAGIGRVVAAMQDPNPLVAGQGMARLRAAGIVVDCGLMRAQAEQLNRGFILRMTQGRPFVTLKLAASLDGRTAMASGESRWISSQAARDDVHRLRAAAGAVLTSRATVAADDPALTVRLPGEWRQPDRIVLDTRGQVPATAKVWQEGARRVRLLGNDGAVARSTPIEGVESCAVAIGEDGRIALPAALQTLGHLEINEVLVECGPVLAGSLLQQGCVDELVLYLAPTLLGHDARPMAHLPALQSLADRIRLTLADTRAVGPDLRLTLRPNRI
ncbi:MAG TPA: bifunctional diaminohydroxyphosphoribosylaminopyrimidine deaminase/5-amino-6-(5-phosphoribosylamino)uracil reductase RibD [Stenotrophobium sp.]|nr:bifunctional diaminohydroxyphosphoribosylaminopyrimidine deaminase/5-amino-6-(5-phosphoribosylamino)uracil reductase RibD [Stenotrophobium sp.]